MSKSTFKVIKDKHVTIEEVQVALRKSGLEGCDLIIGTDFTYSNTYNGTRTFKDPQNRPIKNLHNVNPDFMNPYQEAIYLIGQTLAPFDNDNLIPAYGFGDATTKNLKVFPYNAGGDKCKGFAHVLQRYNEIVTGGNLNMSGPTSFAPIIKKAIKIVKKEKSYHILLIVADGEISRGCLEDTKNAIIRASKYPLSIVVIGVGDGGDNGCAWQQMEEFDDGLPKRKFDNFQFVEMEAIRRETSNFTVDFSINALQEIPKQYKQILSLKLLEKVQKRKKKNKKKSRS